jgi:hypothetical protein
MVGVVAGGVDPVRRLQQQAAAHRTQLDAPAVYGSATSSRRFFFLLRILSASSS